MDFETELKHLKQRMDDLEVIVNSLAGQVRAIHPGLVALRNEAERRFDVADGQMARIVSRLDTVNTQVWSLRDDLPTLFRQAMQQQSGNEPRD